jgi:hypothetical protein
MDDGELIRRFEAGDLESFHHVDHVQLACAYLDRDGRVLALRRLLEGLSRFAASKGASDKFHHTMTRAWLELIVAARREHPDARSAADLLAACPALADAATIKRFYSEPRLHGDSARRGWLPPDLAPFDGTL